VTIPAETRDRAGQRKALRDVISTAPTHLQRHKQPALYSAASQRAARLSDALRAQRNRVRRTS